jgi:hypothetical protein
LSVIGGAYFPGAISRIIQPSDLLRYINREKGLSS